MRSPHPRASIAVVSACPSSPQCDDRPTGRHECRPYGPSRLYSPRSLAPAAARHPRLAFLDVVFQVLIEILLHVAEQHADVGRALDVVVLVGVGLVLEWLVVHLE